eukprot:TRINITY_DN26623_c0_g1_i1.p1 TRINITY_DN26623_c0_g1~~TRINITY_DN26623_c0_g1_i1.p1  ORF type:complete len:940 (-),score=216.04 TRINITY_DN26623_c0_g1_i1:68-2887(-)
MTPDWRSSAVATPPSAATPSLLRASTPLGSRERRATAPAPTPSLTPRGFAAAAAASGPAPFDMADCPGGMRLGQWVQQQVDLSVASAARDVRVVAEAQARLLRVVEGLSVELAAVSAAAANLGTGGSGAALEAHAQAQAQAHAQLAAQQAQHAVELNDLRQQCRGMARFGADLAHLRQLHSDTASNHGAALERFQQLHSTESTGLSSRVTQLEADVAELRKHCSDEVSRHNAVVADLQLLRPLLGKGAVHDNELQELRRQRSEDSTRYENDLEEMRRQHAESSSRHINDVAEMRRLLQSSSATDAMSERLERIESEMLANEKRFCEHATLLQSAVPDIRQCTAELAKHKTKLSDLEQLRDGIDRQESAVAHLQRQVRASPRKQSPEALRMLRETVESHAAIIGRMEKQERPSVTDNTSVLKQVQTWVREELTSIREQLTADLRVELRSAMQSHAAAIKALDEQYWQLDDQLWQTDKRLEGRIEEELARAPRGASAAAHGKEAKAAEQRRTSNESESYNQFEQRGSPHGGIAQKLKKTGSARSTASAASSVILGAADELDAAMAPVEHSPPRKEKIEVISCPPPPAQNGVRRDLQGSFLHAADAEESADAVVSKLLQVSMVRATGLRHLNLSGDAPWCLCEVRRKKGGKDVVSSSCRTAALRNTLEPCWDETHAIEWRVGDSLEFTVYDKGILTSRVEGRVSLASSEFYPSGFDGTLQLSGLPDAQLQVRVAPSASAAASGGRRGESEAAAWQPGLRGNAGAAASELGATASPEHSARRRQQGHAGTDDALGPRMDASSPARGELAQQQRSPESPASGGVGLGARSAAAATVSDLRGSTRRGADAEMAAATTAAPRSTSVSPSPPSREFGSDILTPGGGTKSAAGAGRSGAASELRLFRRLGGSPITSFLAAGDALADGASRLGSPFSPSSRSGDGEAAS